MKNFSIGMQLHAHDIKYEGANTVIHNMQKLGAIDTVYPTCNHTGERQPYPKGELTHNPIKKVYYTKGGLYFEPHLEYYKKSFLKPQRTPESDLKDFDALKAITASAKENGMRVLAWTMAFNDPVIADKYRKFSMVDIYGRRVSGWLCPSNLEVRRYVRSLIEDIVDNYSVDGIFLDRIRFPEWTRGSGEYGKGFDSAFTCFCKECLKRGKTNGMDLSKTRKAIKRIADSVNENQIPRIISKFLSYRRGCLDLAKILVDMPELGEWISYRQDIVTDFVSEVYELVKDINPRLEFSLDLWPPSYSWLLGQNYQKLKKCCDSLKHFSYHKLGGGVDMKAVFDELKNLNPDLEVSPFLGLFYRFFGFSGPSNLDEFGEKGFTVDFVLGETLKALDETRREVRVYPGIQIWDITPEEVKETVRKCFETDIDGIIAFCYGWATLENIRTFGDAMRESKIIPRE